MNTYEVLQPIDTSIQNCTAETVNEINELTLLLAGSGSVGNAAGGSSVLSFCVPEGIEHVTANLNGLQTSFKV